MKLTTSDIANLRQLLTALATCDIDSILIEDGVARGVNEARTCCIISDVDIPKFPQSIGLTRLSNLKQRLDLLGSEVTIEVKESPRGISALILSGGRSKIQFRTTSPALIKAPKRINTTPAIQFTIPKDELKFILDAIRVMSAKNIAIIIKPTNEISIEFSDAAQDTFSLNLNAPAERLFSSENLETATNYYSADILMSAFRAIGENASLIIGSEGIIQCLVNNHAISILPKINEDGENDE